MKGGVKVGKEDNIIFSKLWQDNDGIALKTVGSSPVGTITTKIYVSNPLIDELIGQIEPFLHGDVEEGLWANEDRGNIDLAFHEAHVIWLHKSYDSLLIALMNQLQRVVAVHKV